MRPKAAQRPRTSSNDFPPTVAALLDQSDLAAADSLQEMGAGTGPDAKAARRALHLLKQRGIEPGTAPSATAAPPSVAAHTAVRGFLTNVSGNASQMACFEEADPFGGAPLFHFFLTNFASGLEEVTSRRVPRREVGPLFERLKRGEGGIVTEAPADYVRHLVRLAAEKVVAEGGRIPQGYTESMRRIGPSVQTFERPLIYETYDPAKLGEDLSFSREPEQFFQSPFFRSWFLAMEAVVEWEERYFEAVQSRFAVDQAQRESLGDKVIAEAADALLDTATLRALRRALEEQATVLQIAGHETEAKQALFHALGVDPEQPAHSNPFLLFYVKRSIFVVMAYKAEQEPEPPEEQSAVGEAEPEAPRIERA